MRALTADDLQLLMPQPAVVRAMAAYRPWLPVDKVPVPLLAQRLAWLSRLDPPPEREALVLHRATGTPLGLICLAAIDPENRKAELALAFFRGQGSRTLLEALHWALETAFLALDLEKLVFYVQPGNRAALAVLHALGVAPEACLQREIVLADGSRGDLLRYALFTDAWLSGPGRLRLQRLAPLLPPEPLPSPPSPMAEA